jgi:hypothetical protein
MGTRRPPTNPRVPQSLRRGCCVSGRQDALDAGDTLLDGQGELGKGGGEPVSGVDVQGRVHSGRGADFGQMRVLALMKRIERSRLRPRIGRSQALSHP